MINAITNLEASLEWNAPEAVLEQEETARAPPYPLFALFGIKAP